MIEDIKDIKPPVNLPLNLLEDLWWLWILLVVIAIAAAAFFFLRRKQALEVKAVQPPLPPWEKAIRQLEELAVKGLASKGLWREYYFELSIILRYYIEECFPIKAAEMTTEEFLQKVKSADVLSEDQKNTLKDFMNISDMVKFAKHASNQEEAKASFDLVLSFINETRVREDV